MSKIFEEEYKQLAQDDLPDLWERIEAGLGEKSVATMPAPKKKVISIREYAGLIAACLCVAVVIPVAINIERNSKDMGDSATFEAPSIASEEAYDRMEAAETEEVPAFEMEEAAAGTIQEEAKDESIAETKEDRTYAEGADLTDTTDSTADKQLTNEMGGVSVISETREEARAAYAGVLIDGVAIKGVTLMVTAVETTEDVTVYEAVIQEDPNGLLIQKGRITCTEGFYVEEDMTPGESYQVKLHYYAEDPYLFEVSKILN